MSEESDSAGMIYCATAAPIRRQKPNGACCVDIATAGLLKEMVFLGLVAVGIPIAAGLVLRVEAVAAVDGRDDYGYTVGPSWHVLIKLLSIITLVMAPLFV